MTTTKTAVSSTSGSIGTDRAVLMLGQNVEVFNAGTGKWNRGKLEAIVADMQAVSAGMRPHLRLRQGRGHSGDGFRDVPLAWVTEIRVYRP